MGLDVLMRKVSTLVAELLGSSTSHAGRYASGDILHEVSTGHAGRFASGEQSPCTTDLVGVLMAGGARQTPGLLTSSGVSDEREQPALTWRAVSLPVKRAFTKTALAASGSNRHSPGGLEARDALHGGGPPMRRAGGARDL